MVMIACALASEQRASLHSFILGEFNDNIVGCGSVIMYYSGTIYLDLILSGTD